MKLLVLAAGIGSRFGGVKQLAQAGPEGETLLEYNIFNALEASFDGVVFLIRREIEEDFRDLVLARLPSRLSVELAFQSAEAALPEAVRDDIVLAGRTKPWGTGHALLCARPFLGEAPFAVINGDDFYGKEGFLRIGRFLAGEGVDAGARKGTGGGAAFCLAGYRLGGVVTAKGSVSRAICLVDSSGSLEKIVEHRRIEVREGRILAIDAEGSPVEELSADAIVSMNLWGLGPAVFPWAERLFRRFLEDRANWAKAEFYLPSIVGAMVEAGVAKAFALPVNEEYFGLTNPEDIIAVRRAIADRTDQGVYPSPLWGEAGRLKEKRR